MENKKKLLFDILDAEEKKLQGSCLEQKKIDNYNKRRRSDSNERHAKIEKYKKKESIFKQPELPINRCLRARMRPDHEKNPQKYQYYTLSDVTDTSDRSNSCAAFSFLRDMEHRKREEDEKEASGSSKIVFKNSTKLKPRDDEDTGEKKEKVQGNKFVMKEYVVGEKKQKPKRNVAKDQKSDSAKQLRLSHLDDDEDDE